MPEPRTQLWWSPSPTDSLAMASLTHSLCLIWEPCSLPKSCASVPSGSPNSHRLRAAFLPPSTMIVIPMQATLPSQPHTSPCPFSENGGHVLLASFASLEEIMILINTYNPLFSSLPSHAGPTSPHKGKPDSLGHSRWLSSRVLHPQLKWTAVNSGVLY